MGCASKLRPMVMGILSPLPKVNSVPSECNEDLNESLRILRELKEEGLAEAVKGENGWDIDWIEGNGEEGNMFGLSKDEMKSISPIKRNGCS